MQNFGDADDGDFVVVGDQLNARFGHARAAHAEKFARPCVRAEPSASRAAYMSLEASPAEIRIVGGHERVSADARQREAVSASASERVSHRRAGLREPGRAAPDSGIANSCSLYWSW